MKFIAGFILLFAAAAFAQSDPTTNENKNVININPSAAK
ncbi:accessory gland-specific peptide 57Db-like [Drosophila erecta]|nr:accessory gland-specific peptide 57Db-like [Drosophila erecta]